MPAGVSAYVPLATKTLTATQSTVTFSSISQSYRDLILVVQANYGTATSGYYLRFNNDTTAVYGFSYLNASSTSVSGGRVTSMTFIPVNYAYPSSTNPALSTWHIFDYSDTSKTKPVVHRAGVAESETEMDTGIWRSASAISTVSVISNNVFGVGSTFSLYGVSA